MAILTAAMIIVTAFFTAFLSGTFGMAGGLVLMGVLTALLPLGPAMVTHGVLQISANSWRAYLLRRHIQWKIISLFALGTMGAVFLLVLIPLHPNKASVFLMLGVLPLLVWVPRRWLHLNVRRPAHAVLCGFLAAGFSVTAGISSTVMDIFFVRAALTRHEIVATKAIGQMVGHGVKVIYWSWAVIQTLGVGALPPLWLFALALPLSFGGTWCGKQILGKMTDIGFVQIVRVLISLIGLFYIFRGVRLVLG
ncbi:MAG: TSUP family transporter [Robiginitomaculum sp.]|nr:TSUP family transporter [Robiginitomaculum sp.]MDQ7077747.1 TSUP family transporter [Robiginitomaculum sp.]